MLGSLNLESLKSNYNDRKWQTALSTFILLIRNLPQNTHCGRNGFSHRDKWYNLMLRNHGNTFHQWNYRDDKLAHIE